MSDNGPLGFGARLRRMRTERRLKQFQLAAALRCSQASIAQWESGRVYPGFWQIIELAKFFSVNTDYLLGV